MEYRVPLPPLVAGMAFEEVLASHLQKSRQKKYQSVVLDLSAVEWIELFDLSLLTLWIWELRERGKDTSPSSIPVAQSKHARLIRSSVNSGAKEYAPTSIAGTSTSS